MNPNAVDVLLVEDRVDDAELTIWELKRHRMANGLGYPQLAKNDFAGYTNAKGQLLNQAPL